MSELKPWLEDGAPDELANLLDAARNERPSQSSLSRTLASVGAGVVTASTTAAAATTLGTAAGSSAVATKASMLVSASVFKWLLLGAGVGATVVAVVEQRSGDDRALPATSASAKSSSAARAMPPPAPSAAPRSAPVIAPEPSSKSVAPSPTGAGAVTSAARAQGTSRTPAAIDSERLAEEVRAIDDASKALASGSISQTLAALDDYDRRYPKRHFAPEALFLRMEALTQSRRASEARRVAEQLVAAYPKSPQSARARLVLSQTIP